MKKSYLFAGVGVVILVAVLSVPKIMGHILHKNIEKVLAAYAGSVTVLSYNVSWFQSEISLDFVHLTGNRGKSVQNINVTLQHGPLYKTESGWKWGLFGSTLELDGFLTGTGAIERGFEGDNKGSINAVVSNNPLFWQSIALPNPGPGTLEAKGEGTLTQAEFKYTYKLKSPKVVNGRAIGTLRINKDNDCERDCLLAYDIKQEAKFLADKIVPMHPQPLVVIKQPQLTWFYMGLLPKSKRLTHLIQEIPTSASFKFEVASEGIEVNGVVAKPILVPNVNSGFALRKPNADKIDIKFSYQNDPVKFKEPVSFTSDGVKLQLAYIGDDVNQFMEKASKLKNSNLSDEQRKAILKEFVVDKANFNFEVGKINLARKAYRFLGLDKLMVKLDYEKENPVSLFEYVVKDLDLQMKSSKFTVKLKDFNLNSKVEGMLNSISMSKYSLLDQNIDLDVIHNLNFDDLAVTVHNNRRSTYFEIFAENNKFDYLLKLVKDKGGNFNWEVAVPHIEYDFYNDYDAIYTGLELESLVSKGAFTNEAEEILTVGKANFEIDSMYFDVGFPQTADDFFDQYIYLEGFALYTESEHPSGSTIFQSNMETKVALLEAGEKEVENLGLKVKSSGATNDNVKKLLEQTRILVDKMEENEGMLPEAMQPMPTMGGPEMQLGLNYINFLRTLNIHFDMNASVDGGDYYLKGDITGSTPKTIPLKGAVGMQQLMGAFDGLWYLQIPKLKLDAMVPPTTLQQYEKLGLLKIEGENYVWRLKFTKEGVFLNNVSLLQFLGGMPIPAMSRAE